MSVKKFWGSPKEWPMDSATYVFLARTIDVFGRSIFGNEWTGREITAEPAISLIGVMIDDLYFNNFLATYAPNSGRKYFESAPCRLPMIDSSGSVVEFNQPLPDFDFSNDELQTARSIVERLNSENKFSIERLERVQKEIAQLAESEKLTTAYRSVDGGDQVAIPRVWWNTEKIQSRFSKCQIEPSAPFNNQESGSAWIYVSRESLNNVAGIPGEPRTLAKSEGSARESVEDVKPRPKKAEKKELFKKWRESNGQYVPTGAEDIEHMRTVGVNRADVRALRKEFSRRERGEKKSKC